MSAALCGIIQRVSLTLTHLLNAVVKFVSKQEEEEEAEMAAHLCRVINSKHVSFNYLHNSSLTEKKEKCTFNKCPSACSCPEINR